ncbi:Protein yibA [Salix suchowensis]|nr:Protein yibA [Salix suchowensis]
MGNCINPSTRSWRNEEDDSTKELHQEKGVEPVKESGNVEKAASIKVKLVLTREELEWLMFQLKINGGKKLEDVLGEIERGRSMKVKTWKPSLESVMEIPQGLDENERRVV